MAKDKATRDAWNNDPKGVAMLETLSAQNPDHNREDLLDAAGYYEFISSSEPYAFYHRAVPVKGIYISIDLILII